MDIKFCENCGNKVVIDAVICPRCGKQLEDLKTEEIKVNPQLIINNSNTINEIKNRNERDKWIALLLCLFLGFLGAHKFYERKFGLGIIYIFTFGLFGIGIFIDFIIILCKPNPYYI